MGRGVWDRVIITKNASAHNTLNLQMSLCCVVIGHKSYLRKRQCSYYSYDKSRVIKNTHRSITSMADLNVDIEAMLHPRPPPPGINDAPTPNSPLPPSRCHCRAVVAVALQLPSPPRRCLRRANAAAPATLTTASAVAALLLPLRCNCHHRRRCAAALRPPCRRSNTAVADAALPG
jgi:hypothetical protein